MKPTTGKIIGVSGNMVTVSVDGISCRMRLPT